MIFSRAYITKLISYNIGSMFALLKASYAGNYFFNVGSSSSVSVPRLVTHTGSHLSCWVLVSRICFPEYWQTLDTGQDPPPRS
eukprot:8186558-Pyramimonas_sp.AAC.2